MATAWHEGNDHYEFSEGNFAMEDNGTPSDVVTNPYLKTSDWGWPIDPLGLRYSLSYLADRYHFDCFICVKVTELDDTERFTADSHYADNIYTFLQKNGICPFYSEKVAKEYAGADYEALILYALSRASSLFNLFPLTFTLSVAIFQTVLTLAFGFLCVHV